MSSKNIWREKEKNDKSELVYNKIQELETEWRALGRTNFEIKYAKALQSHYQNVFCFEKVARFLLGFDVPESEKQDELLRLKFLDLKDERFRRGAKAFNERYKQYGLPNLTSENEDEVIRKLAALINSKEDVIDQFEKLDKAIGTVVALKSESKRLSWVKNSELRESIRRLALNYLNLDLDQINDD